MAPGWYHGEVYSAYVPSNVGCRCTVACALVVRAEAWRRESTGTEEKTTSSGAFELRTSNWKEPPVEVDVVENKPMVLSM